MPKTTRGRAHTHGRLLVACFYTEHMSVIDEICHKVDFLCCVVCALCVACCVLWCGVVCVCVCVWCVYGVCMVCVWCVCVCVCGAFEQGRVEEDGGWEWGGKRDGIYSLSNYI
jgi:hypothetical protein